jgi:MYXO-CTERM domain-containing protein
MKKRFMLSTAAIAAVALGSTAMADLAFEVYGPGGGAVSSYDVTGAAGELGFSVDFTNAGGWTYAGDLLIAFMDSAGNAVEYGGYNMSFGYSSIGDFASSWDVSSSGSYSGTIDLTGSGLIDVASVHFADGYSAGASTDMWLGTITGLDAAGVPAPGALALLGLAGIASRRRRK